MQIFYNMKTLTVLSLLFCFTSLTNGQTYIKPRVLGVLNENSCNNTVICEVYGKPELSQLVLNDNSGNYDDINDNDTISNFCIDNYLGSANYKIGLVTSNGYLSHVGFEATHLPVHLNYSIVDYVAPTTMTSTDGSFTIQFDSSDVLTSYDFQLGDNNWVVPDTTQLDEFSLHFSSISWGYQFIGIQNPLSAQDFTQFRVFIGEMNDIYVNTGLEFDLAMKHADGNCDGWIIVQPNNTTGTTLSSWNDNTSTIGLKSDLCPGIYSAYTCEMISGEYVKASIDTFVIADNGTAYIDSNIYTNVQQDTSYFYTSNCEFDFNSAIDSVTYVEDTVFSDGTLTIVTFVMTAYQDSSFYSISDSLIMLNDSLIMLDVVIYCDGISTNKNAKSNDNIDGVFRARRIAMLRGGDSPNFIQSNIGISEAEINETKVYPNPATSMLYIENEFYENLGYRILDLNGKNLMSELNPVSNVTSFDISHLDNGFYLLQIISNSIVQTKRFIKN